jgi:hypothetical protein
MPKRRPIGLQQRKPYSSHELLGQFVLYLFALDDAIRILNWLVRGLIHEVFQ